MSKSYEVYVGNLSTSVSRETLKTLFSQVGRILHVWINPSYKKVTYGFIKFANVAAVEEACRRFNNRQLDLYEIRVAFSKKTERKPLSSNGILMELPKKKGCSKNHSLKKILVKNLMDNKDVIKDFVEAYTEAENIAFPQRPEMIKTAPERSNLKTLETAVIRYFKPTCEKNTLTIDFDFSEGKLLTTEQYDKFLNIKMTKPRSVVVPKQNKKTIPFELDYRSVCG